MNQFVGMEKCGKCNLEVAKTYICEHTHDNKFCAECYQQLHWALTSNV
jgi:hypothetical protein